jgi:hypothetical protein
VTVLAYKALALRKAVAEQVHRATHPPSDVSTYHLTVKIVRSYGGMVALVPPEHLPVANDDPQSWLQRLLRLASRLSPSSFQPVGHRGITRLNLSLTACVSGQSGRR